MSSSIDAGTGDAAGTRHGDAGQPVAVAQPGPQVPSHVMRAGGGKMPELPLADTDPEVVPEETPEVAPLKTTEPLVPTKKPALATPLPTATTVPLVKLPLVTPLPTAATVPVLTAVPLLKPLVVPLTAWLPLVVPPTA
jgi:hypothetical protein